MTPKAYQRLSELFAKAVSLDPDERRVFLDTDCGGDLELRRELEELLAHDSDETAIAAEAGVDARSAVNAGLTPGQMIQQYRIAAEIGRGGMGVVYRAEDTKLERTVALKFVAPGVTLTAEGRQRFLREARAAARLDHPNICTVYEIGDSEHGSFITMAYLEGETLRAQLERGQIAIDKALDYAVQIARGLDAAHPKNIVHRDIKPENLMATRQGDGTGETVLKILDFGIARIERTDAITRAGQTLGTVNYMAPEQIDGTEVDHRADIWALGVVLYEALAGVRPFAGGTPSETLAAISAAKPVPVGETRTGVTVGLDKVINRALEKDPSRRYATASEFHLALQSVADELHPRHETAAGVSPQNRRPGVRWFWPAAAALALLGPWFLGWFDREPDPQRPLGPPVRFTTTEGAEDQPVISPDGTRVAFIWDNGDLRSHADLFVQLTGSYEPLRLTDSPEPEHSPAWSPDGTRLAFLRDIDAGCPASTPGPITCSWSLL